MPRAARLLVAILLLAAAPPSARAQLERGVVPPELDEARFESSRQAGGVTILEGNVEFAGGDARIHAERVVYDENARTVEATGDVVLAFPGAVLTGSRMVYRLDEGTGLIENVVGYLEEDGAIMRAASAERLGPKRIRVEDAIFTTCTQPVPYWSFRMSRGTFDLGQYAYLRGVAFKTGKVPLFYTPYLVWPIKRGRASGFLFPDFNTSDKLGQSFSLPFYWAFADNADVTFLVEGHTRVGFLFGAQLEWLPTPEGYARGEGAWIDDLVRERSRYRYTWSQRQPIGLDTMLRAKIELVSDFDYFTDYETDLRIASTPQTESRVTLTRDWSWSTLTLDARRREQFFVAGTQLASFLSGKATNQVLPEIEMRGRSRRIGSLPLFFSYVASASRFTRTIEEPPADAPLGAVPDEEDLVTVSDDAWMRVDLAPTLRMPLIKQPWGDLSLSAAWRGTYYTHSVDPTDPEGIVDESLSRQLWSAGLSFAGPRIQRIFETPKWPVSPKLKHVIEPFVDYSWRPEADIDPTRIIRVDPEVDSVPRQLSDLRYGIRQRFYILRKPAADPPSALLTAEETSFEAMEEAEERQKVDEAQKTPEEEAAERVAFEPAPTPVELGSIEISQGYSFVRELSNVYSLIADEAGNVITDPVTGRPETRVVGTRSYSPINVSLRFRPSSEQTVDIGYRYDVANRRLTETQVSTLIRLGPSAYYSGRWFRRQPENPAFSDPSSFLRQRVGVTTPDGRLSFEVEADYDIEAGELDHQAYVVRWSTQCCTLRFAYDRRDFADDSREEFSVMVNLTGVGDLPEIRESRTR